MGLAKWCLLAMLGLLASSSTEALILGEAYWVDAASDASIEDIQSVPEDQWIAVDHILSAGYQASPYWLRLDLPAGEVGGAPWGLRLRPAWHDDVQLFDPSVTEVVQIAGDRHPPSSDMYLSLNTIFEVDQLDAPRHLYLRIDSPHSMTVKTDLFSWDEMHAREQVYIAWIFAYLAFLLAALIFSLAMLWSDREGVLVAFCAQLSLSIIYAALMFGVVRLLFHGQADHEMLNQITYAVIILYPMSVLIFYRVLYVDYGMRWWARRCFDLLIGLLLANLMVLIFGWVPEALKWNALVLLVASLFALVVPWFFLIPESKRSQLALPVWMLKVAGALLILGAAWGVARTLFDLNSDAGFEYFLVHSFLLAVVMGFMLQYRARHRLVYIKKDLVQSQARADQERMTREMLERFMSMLSHEIKTPLSVLRLAVEDGVQDVQLKQQAVSSVMDIDQLVMRCLQSDKISSGRLLPDVESVDIESLVAGIVARLGASERVVWVPKGDCYAKTDPWLVEIIFSNLLENALKYGDQEAPIEVQTRSSIGSGGITITVSNALPLEARFDVERIFDKFYRGEAARRVSGAGLGLYLSKSVAELLGGELRYNQAHPLRFVLELSLP